MFSKSVTVSDAARSTGGSALMVCDVSPPRGADAGLLADAAGVCADFLCVAYSPGQSVRVNTVIAASLLASRFGKRVVFNIATRDMNRIALQSLLLGAASMGVNNVVALRGDPLRDRDRQRVSEVNDYTTTELLADISRMNRGCDFRGLRLRGGTAFCAGASADLSKGLAREAALARRKVEAGAEFLLCQGAFEAERMRELAARMRSDEGRPAAELFAGVQMLDADGVAFGDVPERLRRDLGAGRAGLDIAMENAEALWESGCRRFYVIPPILGGGARDYDKANRLMEYIAGFR